MLCNERGANKAVSEPVYLLLCMAFHDQCPSEIRAALASCNRAHRSALSAVHPVCSSSGAQTLQDSACSTELHSTAAEGKSCSLSTRIRRDKTNNPPLRSTPSSQLTRLEDCVAVPLLSLKRRHNQSRCPAW